MRLGCHKMEERSIDMMIKSGVQAVGLEAWARLIKERHAFHRDERIIRASGDGTQSQRVKGKAGHFGDSEEKARDRSIGKQSVFDEPSAVQR